MSVDKAIKASLAGVELAEHKLTAFQYSLYGLRRDNKNPALEAAITTIWSALYAECLEAYRRVFMWGTVVPNKARAAAKKLALERFLNEHNSVMNYLNPDGAIPSRWASEEEKKFREEIKFFAKGK